VSDDPTKNIEEKYHTRPTIETVLERIEELREETRAGFAQIDGRLKKVEGKIGVLNEDVLELRSDMRELKNALKVHEPR
jgi:predicted  nucleic acid-binding Zn-ribbon protein